MRNSLICLAMSALMLGLLPRLSWADDFAPNSFEEVTERLDEGGDIYIYLSTDAIMRGIGTRLEGFREMVVTLAAMEEGEEGAAQIDALSTMVIGLFDEGGFRDVRGVGLSSVQTDEVNHRTKTFLHAPRGLGSRKLLDIYGTQAHPLHALKLLPRDTVMAINTDFDAKLAWTWLNELIVKADGPDWVEDWNHIRALYRDDGIDLDRLIGSMAGEFTVLVTMNSKRRVQLPLGEGVAFEIGEPAIALAVKVTDSTLFDLIDGKLKEMEVPHTRVDEDDLKMRLLQAPMEAPFKMLPVIAQVDGYFIFASSDDLVLDIANTLRERTPGLAATPEFARWSRDLPTEGNAFMFVAPTFSKMVVDVKKTMIDAALDQDPDVAVVMPVYDLLISDEIYYIYQVGTRTEDGYMAAANSSQTGFRMLASQFLSVPAVAGAAVVLPKLIRARERVREVASMNNMRQIGIALTMYAQDNNRTFPTPDGVAGLQTLRAVGYLDHDTVWQNPLDDLPPLDADAPLTDATTSYAYLGAGLSEHDEGLATIPVLIEKHPHDGWVNVLFADGHVLTVPTDKTTLEGLIQDLKEEEGIAYTDATYQRLLQKARALDAVQGAGPATGGAPPANPRALGLPLEE